MRLTLVRHGETAANVRGELDMAPPGPELTERGREQARALVDRFAAESFDAVFSSPLIRTVRTAEPVAAAKHLSIRLHDGLREFGIGTFEKRSDPEAIAAFVEVMRRWLLGDPTPSMGGGETGQQILDRMDVAMSDICDAVPDTALVVSHGGVLRVWAALRCANIDPDFAVANYLVNTGVVVVEGSPGDWRCDSWDRPPPHH